jgi:hypothetical protein
MAKRRRKRDVFAIVRANGYHVVVADCWPYEGYDTDGNSVFWVNVAEMRVRWSYYGHTWHSARVSSQDMGMYREMLKIRTIMGYKGKSK